MPKNRNFLLSIMTPPPPCWPPFRFLPGAFSNYQLCQQPPGSRAPFLAGVGARGQGVG